MDIPNWALALLTIGFGVIFGVFGYFLKDIRASVKEKQSEHTDEIKSIRKEFADFRADLPKEYVLRDDFIRTIAGIEKKMDIMTGMVVKLNRNLSKMLGGEEDNGE